LQVLLVPLLLRLTTQKVIIIVGLIGSTIEMAMLGLAPFFGTWAVYLAVSIGSVGSMTFPIISALKSVNVDETEQGKIQVGCSSDIVLSVNGAEALLTPDN
jgi:fucose permease